MEIRYAAIREAARTRSIVSLGVSMFVETAGHDTGGNEGSGGVARKRKPHAVVDHCYDVHTYNIYLSCADSYVVVCACPGSSVLRCHTLNTSRRGSNLATYPHWLRSLLALSF